MALRLFFELIGAASGRKSSGINSGRRFSVRVKQKDVPANTGTSFFKL